MKYTFTVEMETENDVCTREQLKGYLQDFLMEGSDGVAEDSGYGDGVHIVLGWNVS